MADYITLAHHWHQAKAAVSEPAVINRAIRIVICRQSFSCRRSVSMGIFLVDCSVPQGSVMGTLKFNG